jgi:hypothetical protein
MIQTCRNRSAFFTRKRLARFNIFLRASHHDHDVWVSFSVVIKPINSHLHEDRCTDAHENASNLHSVAGFGSLRPAAKKTYKGNPYESKGSKAKGPRFLRETMDEFSKDPKIAGSP